MKIQPLYNFKNSIFDKKSVKYTNFYPIKTTLEKDVFQKSTPVSFKGQFPDGYLDSFLAFDDDAKEDVLIASYLGQMAIIKDSPEYKHVPFQVIHEAVIATFKDFYGEQYIKYVDNFLKNWGVKSLQDLNNLIEQFKKYSKDNPNILVDAKHILRIRQKLNDKNELSNFPAILACFQKQQETYIIQKTDVNDLIKLLHKIGVKNEKDFCEKFAHLKSEFDNFEYPEDKLSAALLTYHEYQNKEAGLEFIINSNPQLKGIKPEKLYSNYCDIIDYLYSQSDLAWVLLFERIALLNPQQTKISKKSSDLMNKIIDTSTAKSKLEFWLFLSDERLTIETLNNLTSLCDLSDTNSEDIVINRSTIIENIIETKNMDFSKASEFYSKFAQSLNAAYECEDSSYSTDGLGSLMKIINDFGLKSDKDLIKLYNELKYGNTSKNKKAKKKSTPQKPSQKDIRDFIELLSFMDSQLLEKYKKNPASNSEILYSTLKKRKDEFEKIKPQIIQSINKANEERYCIETPFDIYKKYTELSLKKPISLSLFLNSLSFAKLEDVEKYSEFKVFLNKESQIFEFISKNEIKADNSNESRSYFEHCLEILKALNLNRNEKARDFYRKKLLNCDFIKNSKSSLAKLLSGKSQEEIMLLFNTILQKNINNIQELNEIFSVCKKAKNKMKIIQHFYNQDNLDKDEYIKRMQRIRNLFSSYNIPLEINEDNIQAINLEEYPLNKKMTQKELIHLASKMGKINSKGNFITSLEEAKQTKEAAISPEKAAREITNSLIADRIPNCNILRELKLPVEKEISEIRHPVYMNMVFQKLDNNFMEILNDNEYEIFEDGEKFSPNITIHAKVRALERFVLNNEGSIEKLHTGQAKQELSDLFKTIYTTDPIKIEASQNDTFVAYFNHTDANIVKAVFTKTGILLTVASQNY